MRAAVSEEEPPPSGCTLLIYIHGFNVDRHRSELQWRTLRSKLDIGTESDRTASGQLVWPSDVRESRHVSRMAYPIMVGRAQKAGRLLGDYLGQRASNRVVLVGHSLGASVALAAADRLRGRSTPIGLALLGAAVRTEEMEAAGSYGVFPLAFHEVIAFSPRDRVLKSFFRTGELLSTPFMRPGPPVGLTGTPADRGWERFGSRLDHHEYWRFEGSTEVISRALGRPDVKGLGWEVAERNDDLVL